MKRKYVLEPGRKIERKEYHERKIVVFIHFHSMPKS